MPGHKLTTQFSIFLSIIFFVTTFFFSPNISLAADPKPATGFIYPVLGDGVTDPKQNTVDPRPGTQTHDDCEDADSATNETLWYSSGNDFGNNYCPPSLGCGWSNCYHPGEDWNLCPSGYIEDGVNVYAVANGKVVRKSTVLASGTGSGHYVTIRHDLPKEEKLSDYAFSGTTTSETFSEVYSTYAHIDTIAVEKDDIVEKGDLIGKISACCGHLHFEMKTQGENITGCSSCGYCSSEQALTDNHFLEPDKFIRAHIEGIDLFDDCQFYWDVWPDKWYFLPIMRLSCAGIIQGYPDGYYRPGNSVNRAEMIKLVVEASGAMCEGGCISDPYFSDVTDPSEWYYDYVKTAYNNGWLDHMYGCNYIPCVPAYFEPGRDASRGWIAYVIVKALGMENLSYAYPSPFDDIEYGDAGYAEAARTRWLNIFFGYENKKCNGDYTFGEVNFCYDNPINRAEAAAVVERAFLRESAYQ